MSYDNQIISEQLNELLRSTSLRGNELKAPFIKLLLPSVFLLKNILPEDPKFLFMLRRGGKIITYNSTLFFHVSS